MSRNNHGYPQYPQRISGEKSQRPTTPMGERKRARTWDQPPPQQHQNMLLTQLLAIQQQSGIVQRAPQPPPNSLMNNVVANPQVFAQLSSLQAQQQQQRAQQQQQKQQRQARRLYIGNIPPSCTIDSLKMFFHERMREAGVWHPHASNDPPPIVDIQLNHDKGYAFIEFRGPLQATQAMGFDGVTLNGQALKVRRPTDYQPLPNLPQQHAHKMPLIQGAISTKVEDGPNKLFIGGIPSTMNDQQVRDLLQAYGRLKAFNLVKDGARGTSKGFAFCEYVDPKVTEIACQGLNHMKLQDKILIVQRASLGARGGSSTSSTDPYHQHTTTVGAGELTPSVNIMQQAGDILDLSKPLAPTLANLANHYDLLEESPVLVLYNCMSLSELRLEDFYNDLVIDMHEQCSKYGRLRSITIPKPPSRRASTHHRLPLTLGLGKVFVQFEKIEDASKAYQNLPGMKYNSRTVTVAFYPYKKYQQQLYNC